MKTPSPPSPLSILFTTLLFILPALAQFQFFDQMFNQQQQQQQPQNAGSDSLWYRQQYDAGELRPLPIYPSALYHSYSTSGTRC
ncbi:hypothetical protein D6C98_07924 [Aureobasidium pullulans]|uniref:Uncharacterized protein n=1 Tax=Aureobasidium pullulans TaxID=5580 RepID=A0A4S8WE31_AURPU|nr:hypothetical protein D6D24_01253 [Aureobasidium pullulans]THW23909.1 hypothetical protein D6D23_05447 [Aureobasidium pullulans]THW32492.1 hypothetical protein D6D21_10371 [Aureobasidium pullulans]THW57650.1 hypothetical protein D6D20_07828 [Aureobasidium pullulans]THW90990.1 hypothetical protein D6D18_06630 [Aureobasidium pullulans]